MLQLKAGREMDKLVAECVLRMTKTVMGHWMDLPPNVIYWSDESVCDHDSRLPNYSTDLTAAWDIVKKMEADGWIWRACNFGYQTEFEFQMYIPETKSFVRGYGDGELPYAICAASLRAVA